MHINLQTTSNGDHFNERMNKMTYFLGGQNKLIDDCICILRFHLCIMCEILERIGKY